MEFSAEDATRSDLEFLCDVAAAVVEAGATTRESARHRRLRAARGHHAHVHARSARASGPTSRCRRTATTTSGMAVANSLAAVQAGARQVECTINGIGERAGNASLEEIVMALHVRRDRLPFETAIRTTELCATSRLLSEIVGVPVPPNKAIVGANAFAHEAGIHQDGVLKNPLTYEILRPEAVGAPGTRLVLGQAFGHARRRCALPRARLPPASGSARARLRAAGGDRPTPSRPSRTSTSSQAVAADAGRSRRSSRPCV